MNAKIQSYNFPLKHPLPFDDSFDGNYFVYARKFSNLGQSIDEFSFDTLVKYIPTGYKTIIINHRELLINKGEFIKSWDVKMEHVVAEHEKNYILYSAKEVKEFVVDWNRFEISNVIRKPTENTADLKSSLWKDKQKCIDYGIEMSKKHNCRILLSKVIKTISWH